MLSSARTRIPSILARISPAARRSLSASSSRSNVPATDSASNVSKTDETTLDAAGVKDSSLQELASDADKYLSLQAPNRASVWSRSQMPREMAMRGPRFEQTDIEAQPRPLAAIGLIHKQPVRFVDTKVVACDGGGGPLGHPKIFINTDKAKVCVCTYCGLPYANVHHKKHLESLPSTPYPLKSSGDPDEVQMPSTPSQMGEGRHPQLMGELEAQGVDGQPFAQR